jgi:ubiquinone/menaquinone biosynthesis C-methylase UbiE
MAVKELLAVVYLFSFCFLPSTDEINIVIYLKKPDLEAKRLLLKAINMANLYDKYVLPQITHWVCTSSPARKQRQKVVPHAHGRVLEIGAGSGLNLEFYDPTKVDRLFALEPSEEMWAIARQEKDLSRMEVEFLNSYAEAIPLDDNTVDCVVTTFTMCSIPDLPAAYSEMRRVLKPGGTLLFSEHGRAPDASVRRWQNLINPVWKRLAGGCHLNRDIPELIKSGGFSFQNLDGMYIPGPKFASYQYWGAARPR